MVAKWINPVALVVVASMAMTVDLFVPGMRIFVHSAVYFLSTLLCLEVARDYDHKLMRLSWLLFAGEPFFLAISFPLGIPGVVAWLGVAQRDFLALVMVQLGLTCLLAGMIVTWWQLRQFGLGFHALRRDWAAVGIILVGMAVFCGLSMQGGWMSPMMAGARVLLFLAAAVSVLLNRFCQQMGGGEIARVIRFIIAYVATRCVMNLVFAVNKTWAPVAQDLEVLLNVVFPWIFLLGVTLRARVAVRAEAELARAGVVIQMTRVVSIVLGLFAVIPGLMAADTFTNPVGKKPIVIGDPFVLQHGGSYYLFGTDAPDGFRCSVSKDLVHWTEGGYAWRREADSWSDPPYWAPEVKYYRGKFYMTYSGRVRGSKPARLLTALAVSDRPEGPYQDLYAPWFDPGYSVIDADILVDADGTPYLYFSRNGSQDGYAYGVIYGVELTRDLSKPVGEPVKLLEASQEWERINWDKNRCNEGPTVIRHGKKYVMTYSANNTSWPGYGVGVATADRPLGPWVKDPKNPILAGDLDIGVSSPGHNSITHSPDGKEMFIVYHSHADPAKPSQVRVMNIDRMVFEGDGLRVMGPTRTPQPMPSGAPRR